MPEKVKLFLQNHLNSLIFFKVLSQCQDCYFFTLIVETLDKKNVCKHKFKSRDHNQSAKCKLPSPYRKVPLRVNNEGKGTYNDINKEKKDGNGG